MTDIELRDSIAKELFLYGMTNQHAILPDNIKTQSKDVVDKWRKEFTKDVAILCLDAAEVFMNEKYNRADKKPSSRDFIGSAQ